MTADAQVLTALIRVAVAKARLRLAELEEVGTLLAAGRITPAGGLHLLWQIGADDLVLGSSKMVDVDQERAA